MILAYPDENRSEDFIKMGCKYVKVPFDSSSANPIGDIRLFLLLNKVIRQHSPDIALLYTIKPCIYAGAALRILHIPYICTVTGISPALISPKAFIRIVTKHLSRIGYNGASVVFFQNKMNLELYQKLRIAVGKHRLVAGSGVNTSKFEYCDYPEPSECTRYLYVGRLKKIKGLEELISALLGLHDQGEKVICRIVGESGDDIKGLDEAIREGVVIHEDFSYDVRPYLEWCDAFILPSYGEGMSNVLQEAAASGRPVLASDIPGCREIFDEGVTGIGFEPKNPDSLMNAMKHFAAIPHEKRVEMGKAARCKMEREFDRKHVVKAYTDAIKDIIGD